eukprot:CAMPEP_0202352388 /NCGR_PEP_ID=MMETSP1126-20121109/8605_1 /ASSEMBLY_ACC=CAM_ASM_000457 /TAXON_ID=3047 /ORGANISM="Dunaliella tertiolecta, Strain CCMP1320" /LENGTH=196 /DNA_ID=CAMNT_0048944599 /DNA_START=200 /DNA_END=790 /DNA_ORIENTATION=+
MPSRESAGHANGQRKVGVLFVCLGNICRSPTAEAMFKAVVKTAGLEDAFDIDSCGTGGGNEDWFLKGGWSYHEGEDADRRMAAIAKQRGVILTSKSRPLQPLDLDCFDYIIGMEGKNMKEMTKAINYWRDLYDIPEDYMSRMSLMTQYCSRYKVNGVPDPYYAEGPDEQAAFNTVLDLLEDACVGLLEHIKKDKQL